MLGLNRTNIYVIVAGLLRATEKSELITALVARKAIGFI
jgi:hypothetical protein